MLDVARNTLLNFHYFSSRLQPTEKPYQKASKNIQFYSYVVCFVLSGIFSMFFNDILELIDRQIVIICT